MADVDVSAEARADMLALHTQSTERFGLDVADKYIDGVNQSLARLAQFPLSGPVLPGIRPAARYLKYKQHHILYDFDGETIWVIRIIHHARDVRGLM